MGGVKRKAIAILFHALIEAMAAVKNASSLSLNSLRTASYASSLTPAGVTPFKVSVHASAAIYFALNTPASRHIATRSSFVCGTSALRARFR